MLFGSIPKKHRKDLQMTDFPPNDFSKECLNLVSSLLRPLAKDRLGASAEADVFKHPWYKCINFSDLLSKNV